MTTKEIVSRLKVLVKNENEITIEILELLKIMELNDMYLELGFSSPFDFCINELELSETQSSLRINAMRTMIEVPGLQKKLEAGDIKLTQVSEITKAINKVEKFTDQKVELDQKIDLFEKSTSKTREETKTILKQEFREALPQTERFVFELDPELVKLFKEFKNKESHKLKKFSNEAALKLLLELAAKNESKRDEKVEQSIRTTCTEHETPRNEEHESSRYIPIETRRTLFKKAEHQCEYVCEETGRRCNSKTYLQVDHRKSYSKEPNQDRSNPENFQILCGAHNRFKYRHSG